jgi:general L-amino acid transport system substrate-binding protein
MDYGSLFVRRPLETARRQMRIKWPTRVKVFFLGLLSLVAVCVTGTAHAQLLKTVKDRGALNCGVSEGLYGFSARDDKGDWSGFDVDLCRAIAAAIFNDANKVSFTPLAASRRFEALQSGRIDVLSRNTTWTMSREIELALSFVATNYYDGQGFLVRRATNKESVSAEAAIKGYDSGHCDALTADLSQLFAIRLLLSKPNDHFILPDVISKEPLGPVVRQGDIQWFNIVKWIHFAMVNAEELGVTSKNIDEMMRSDEPAIRRLVGNEGNYGEKIGLTNDWAARVVRRVGNYGEVFERTVGIESPLGIPRGINQLWSAGGILYAPPIR